MASDHSGPVCLVESSGFNIEEFINTAGGPNEFRSSLQNASVLLLPSNLPEEGIDPVFPDTTPYIFDLLKENLKDTASVDAAIHDDKYEEFQYLSDDLILPVIFVANGIVLPLVITILGNYLYDHFTKGRWSSAKTNVKGKLYFKGKNGESLSLEYEGPADTYKDLNLQQIRELGLLLDKEPEEHSNETVEPD